MIQLDTSFVIHALLRGSKADAMLRSWLRDGEELGMSSIAYTEFLCGPVSPAQTDLVARIVPICVPFTEGDASLAAEMFNIGGRRRGSIVDCMIAESALRQGSALATGNPAEFRRFQPAGLKIIEA